MNSTLQNNVKVVWSFLSKKRKREIILLQTLIFLSAISEAITLAFINFYLNIFINSNSQDLYLKYGDSFINKIPDNSRILLFGGSLIFFIVFSALLRILTVFFQYKISSRLTFDIGTKVFSNIIQRSYEWHLKVNSGHILGVLSNDVERVRDSIQYFLAFINNFIILVLISLTLLKLSPQFSAILFVLVSILFFSIYKLIYNSLERDGKKSSKSYIDGLKSITETKGSIKDIIIQNNHYFFVNRYQEKLKKYLLANAQNQTKYNTPRFMVEGFIISGLILFTISLYFFGSDNANNIPIYGTIILGIYRLIQPAQQCFVSSAVLKANSASWKNISPYLLSPDEKYCINNQDKNIKKKSSIIYPIIKLENISFKFGANLPWIIKSLNIKIFEGNRIGFVGQTGVGKTTCADIIAGLLKPTKGKIYIDGENLYSSNYNLKKWQNSLAHVPQDIYLLEDTFTNNIAFGVPKKDIDISKVILCAKKACLHDLIMSNKEGYDHIIGERGKLLSGGQKQRVAIARALYKKSRFIIFDEATSALDNLTENSIMNSINSFDKKITMLLIAHRISTIKKCDFLVFFTKENVFINSYKELYENNVEFRNLVDKKGK